MEYQYKILIAMYAFGAALIAYAEWDIWRDERKAAKEDNLGN